MPNDNRPKLSASQIATALIDWTVQHSGFEERAYLGMSSIGDCPRALYRQFVLGRSWNRAGHLMCYAGYLWERDIKQRLGQIGLYADYSEREVVASFDDRFCGHTDGELIDGSLLEIKSVTQARLDTIRALGRIPTRHFEQVQAYLRHGHYERGIVVYVARDTDEIYVAHIKPNPEIADRIDRKARDILAAIDAGQEPLCTCGRCKESPLPLGEG